MSGEIYVVIRDDEQILDPAVYVTQVSPEQYRATLHTREALPVGHYQGSFEVQLCSTLSCSHRYASSSLGYDLTVNPSPKVESLQPTSAILGGPDFMLTVRGTSFATDTVVAWNGVAKPTIYVSPTELTAQIQSSDLFNSGSNVEVSVRNASGSGVGTAYFTIRSTNLGSVAPASFIAGSESLTLTLEGNDFLPSSTVHWDYTEISTTYVSPTRLTATVPQQNLASAGAHTVFVTNGLDVASNSLQVTGMGPTVTLLSPAEAPVMGSDLVLTVHGSNFASTSVVQWFQTPLATTYVSDTELRALVPAGYLTETSSLTVYVLNGNSAYSNNLIFVVSGPEITSLAPSTTTAGGPSFTLTVDGTNFVPSSVVRWNNQTRPTTYVSPTRLTAVISTADIAVGGSEQIDVANGSDPYQDSFDVAFVVNNPVPVVSSVDPSVITTGGPALTITVSGNSFLPSSEVHWNGSPRETSYVSPTTLTAKVSEADIALGGGAYVSVYTGQPAGGQSGLLGVTIRNPQPAIAHLNANTSAAGCDAFTLYVIGSNFVPNSQVAWNGNTRDTEFRSDTLLAAQVSAAELAAAGTAEVTVLSPEPGGGATAPAAFTITDTAPPSSDAVTGHIDPAFTGIASTRCPLVLPSGVAWSFNQQVSSSPIIADGRVYIGAGAQLHALDPSNGAPLWGPVADSGHTGLSYASGRLFRGGFNSETSVVRAYDAASGALEWTAPLPNPYGVGSYTNVGNGLVYSSGAYLYALKQDDGSIVWDAELQAETHVPALAADGAYVSLGCQSTKYAALTGEVIWDEWYSCYGGGGWHAVVGDGMFIAVTAHGDSVWDVRDSDTGELINSFPANVSPALEGHVAYFLYAGQLRAVNVLTAEVLWTWDSEYELYASPVVVNGTVFVATSLGLVIAIDSRSGEELWRHDPQDYGPIWTMTAGNDLLMVTNSERVRTYRIATQP